MSAAFQVPRSFSPHPQELAQIRDDLARFGIECLADAVIFECSAVMPQFAECLDRQDEDAVIAGDPIAEPCENDSAACFATRAAPIIDADTGIANVEIAVGGKIITRFPAVSNDRTRRLVRPGHGNAIPEMDAALRCGGGNRGLPSEILGRPAKHDGYARNGRRDGERVPQVKHCHFSKRGAE